MKTNNIGGVSKNVCGDVCCCKAIATTTTINEYVYEIDVAIAIRTSMFVVRCLRAL